MSWSRIFVSAIALAIVLSLTVGSVESAVPNATNKKFYACMNKRTRIIKMLNYPKVKSCPKRDKRISWNAKGNPGLAGPAGPGGPAGSAGAAGITKITLTPETSDSLWLNPGDNESIVATCPAGKVVGGGYTSGTGTKVWVSQPWYSNGWSVQAVNTGSIQNAVHAIAICMTTDPGTVIASKKNDFKPAKVGKMGKKKRR